MRLENNKVCSYYNIIKQEEALTGVNSNLRQSNLMLKHKLRANIKSGIFDDLDYKPMKYSLNSFLFFKTFSDSE